ncbi:MAG TPA: hypothetical protein VKB65_02695 [Myxococcota bacterium]|nr:hypothetical protein [Myxococcota bacterium]
MSVRLARAFDDMPLALKGLTSFFVVFGAGSLLLPLVPGVEQRVAGRALDPAEFFASGHGVFALVMGAWLVAAAAGLLARARWACWAAVLAWALFVPAEAVLAEAPRVATQAALAAAWALGVGAYLFRTRGARAFFRSTGR